MNNEPLRPDPDRLLEQTAAPHRGKLKVFFGACAGVGKTWAMLAEAQRLRAQGLDIVVGVVETHGRKDTAAMLEGLAVLPLKRQAYRGRHISEFDLDAALARRPALILMDELAHSNAPGSRHPKRWQDIEELLEAGIDVFTTVNVQHLESLNDVVSGVTGIQVRETVPDPFFDAADDVVLVDLPPDDLRQRLKEGKVYIAGQAERAIEHFFRKGNLIALRELALRRTADRVDEQMRAWRGHPGEEKVWHTRDAILLCIGHNTGSEKLVRAAARLASRLGSVWHAVYVETPALHRLPEKKRRAILSALRLAQELGAETATLSDPAEEKAVVRYAREHNLGKIILGRPASRRWWRRETFADRLARIAPDLDQVLVALDEPPARTINNAPDSRSFKDKWRVQIQGCVVAAALCAVITLIAMQWLMAFDAANLVMLYLLGVVVVALFYGRWPSVVATVINVVSFDLFFIAPRGTLAVSDVQYLLTFAVMLTVGLVIGNLTAGVRYQARVARYREQRTRHLYEMSKALAVGRSSQDIAATSEQFIASTFHARSQVLLPDDNGKLQPLTHPQGMTPWDDAIAQWSFDKGLPAGAGTDTLPGVPYQILPLKSGEKTYGLVVVEPGNLRQLMIPEQQRLLETFTLLVANALERLTLTASEEQARMASEREQIRNALLAALSHDLRTPLTVLFGQAETLQRGLLEAATRKPDLIILDLGLPDGDGIEFIRDLRQWSAVPVIVLSARSEESDKIAALDAGADDYLSKPFGIGELQARLRVALRRHSATAAPDPLVKFSDVTVDLAARVIHRGEEEVHLTPIEFRLLAVLLNNAGKVLTQRQLLNQVWGPNAVEHSHYLRIYMGHLRQKLEQDPARPRHFITETGIGYRFMP